MVSRTGRFGLVTLTLGAADEAPFALDAVVIAQDRWLLMDASTPVEDSAHGYRSLARAAAASPGATPGSVLVRRGRGPLRLWAVIHDLDADPTCRAEWIARALRGVMTEVVRRGLHTLSLPALGCRDGVLTADAFLDMLVGAIREVSPVARLRVWIPVPHERADAVCGALARLEF
jgi:hypothetical protein